MTKSTSPSPWPEKARRLLDLIETVHRLRAPGGCPWDRAQTHQSLRQYLIEEAYEVMDVLDQIGAPGDLKEARIQGAFKEELGDLLMQVLLHSEMAAEGGAFDIYDVAAGLDDKLIRRHPHVFSDVQANSEETALRTWEKQKLKEKRSNPDASVLDGVPRGMPALQKAARVIEKVTQVGFQWSDMRGPLAKVEEELGEMKAEVLALEKLAAEKGPENNPANPKDTPEVSDQRKKLAGEIGDLFFTLANVAYLMKVNPEDALRGTLARFDSRFRHVERRLKQAGKTPEQSSLQEMDRYWDEAKSAE